MEYHVLNMAAIVSAVSGSPLGSCRGQLPHHQVLDPGGIYSIIVTACMVLRTRFYGGLLATISGECSDVRQRGRDKGHEKEGSENDRSLTTIFKEAIWDRESIVYNH